MGFAEISVHEAKALLEGPNPPLLVDCREESEYGICHLENAMLIPFPHFMRDATDLLTDRSRPIIIVCHFGVRSAYAADFLTQLGYEDVRTVAGGLEAWANEIDPSMRHY